MLVGEDAVDDDLDDRISYIKSFKIPNQLVAIAGNLRIDSTRLEPRDVVLSTKERPRPEPAPVRPSALFILLSFPRLGTKTTGRSDVAVTAQTSKNEPLLANPTLACRLSPPSMRAANSQPTAVQAEEKRIECQQHSIFQGKQEK